MSKTVTVEIQGKEYVGTATDMDGFFAAGLLMPDFEEILAKNKGLDESFQRFAAEQRAMEAIGSGDFLNAIATTWGERALLRLMYNREIMLGFAMRVRKIFKDLPKDLVSYDRWSEAGRLYEDGAVSLDMGEAMSVLVAMMQTLADAKVPAPAPDAAPKSVPAVAPVTPEAIDQEVAKLEAQIKKLKGGKGFG